MRAGWLTWCGLAVILALAGCTGPARDAGGEVTASASVDPFSIKVGDCTGDLGQDQITAAELLPCSAAHYWEAYSSSELSGQAYPGVTQVKEQADKWCTAAFKSFVGVSTDKSDYTYTYFYPTEQTWTTTNDREVLCLVGLGQGGVTGSLKDARK